MKRRSKRRYGRARLGTLHWRFREDYYRYPSASLLLALRREVKAAGGEVREWDEGRDMYVGIYVGPGSDLQRLNKIAWAYSKAKKYFLVASGSFGLKSELAIDDFERRMREVA